MIPIFDYLESFGPLEDEVMDAVSRVLRSGQLILGPETVGFEREFADYVSAGHAVGVTSGTAALHLALLALGVGPGDEVITVSNTCAPTISAIRLTGALPVFVDVDPRDLMMDVRRTEEAISGRTRCILPVHLFGSAVDMAPLMEVARARSIPVVEDCAQATGTTYGGRHVGTIGDIGCFSFYPTKNLGAYGDAGMVVTARPELADRVRQLRMYGYDGSPVAQMEGTNARISEVQAAVLRVKLPYLDASLATRRSIAATYDTLITAEGVRLPPVIEDVVASYHLYVVRCRWRDEVIARLRAAEIGCGIHYPVPVHLMPAYEFLGGEGLDLPVTIRASGEVLSLPMHDGLTSKDAQAVAAVLNDRSTKADND